MRQQTTPERFPVIGHHLISEQNPAYAPTSPPEPADDPPAVSPETVDRASRLTLSPLARFFLAVRRWL